MRRRSYGYGSYRGRGNPVLKVIVAVLAVILILAVVVFLGAERYMVYDDSGEARLELPFFKKEDDPKPTETAPPSLPPVVTPSPEVVVPEQPEKPETILPVWLSQEALYDGSAAEAVTEGGGTAALFDMKQESGMLGWVSDQELAIKARVSAGDPELNEKIRAAAEEDGVYRIARVSCFKDQELSNVDLTMAVTAENGMRWLDIDKHRWLSPADERVQAYIIALCEELAELGFDEILLEYAGYPTKGRMSVIKQDGRYDPATFETVISGFYGKLSEALSDTEMALSVVYDPDTTALSGQSEKKLKELGIGIVSYNEDGILVWQK